MAIINTLAAPLSKKGAKIYSQDALGNPGWIYADIDDTALTIGSPGEIGFGVGVCPPDIRPSAFTPMTGYADPASPNYGNYQYSDGSVMVWVPKFYYRINNASNPTYSTHTPNDIDIRGTDVYATRAAAEAAGYALHRAFIDGGVEQPGFFIDKYQGSKNAKGTGFIMSSIRYGLPLSADAAHNPVGELTATTGSNILASFVTAPKARDGENGLVNTSSIFHCFSVFQSSALAMLSLAHGQASTGTANCAWWSATTTNFPKGDNNNALKDANDVTVIYQSDGYSNCGKTGSGSSFAKTTHNGQECGIADLNGNMWEALIGMTCIGTSKNISGVTLANPCVVTVASHGYATGQIKQITGIVGTTQLNDKMFTITVIDANTFSLDEVNSTAYTPYTSGGSVSEGTFYAAKESTRMRDFTSGNTLVTDHWGATGITALMEPITAPFVAASGGSACAQFFGNGVNHVLSGAASGDGYKLASIGFPKDSSGVSTGGTDLFGKDYFYQYFRNESCLLGCGSWVNGTSAGLWSRYLNLARSNANNSSGCRAACYLLG